MKQIVFILFIFYSEIIYSQSNCTQDSTLYMIAYNYIVNDSINSGKTIIVSDSIIDLDRYWFSAEPDDFPEEKIKLNNYRENKRFIWSETYFSPCLNALFHPRRDVSTDKVIFFSQIEDNMLLADLLPYKRGHNIFNYDHMAFQTIGRVYLFIFCKSGFLRLATSREIIYD